MLVRLILLIVVLLLLALVLHRAKRPLDWVLPAMGAGFAAGFAVATALFTRLGE